MSGHEKRREKKTADIKSAAKKLYNKYGFQKVTIGEIAELAGVSKVTIYKYFTTKEALIETVIRDIYGEFIEEIQELVESDKTFPEKLKRIIETKVSSSLLFNGDFLRELFSSTGASAAQAYNEQIKALTYKFFDTGKKQGYIDESIDNNTLYLYYEIFNNGLQAIFQKNPSFISDKKVLGTFIDMYFYGLMKRDGYSRNTF